MAQGGNGAVVPHHGQGPDHLSQRHLEGGQIGAFFGIAEEAIKHLLDLRKIGLDLLGHLGDQQFFLSLARHFVELRHFGARHGRIFGDAAVNPLDHDVDLVGEILAKPLEVLLCVLRQQDRCGDLHGQRLGVA